MARYLEALVVLFMVLLVAGCITSPDGDLRLGIQPGHQAYVPARIAVLPCQIWPHGAQFAGWRVSATPQPDAERDLCQAIDQFVIAGFKDQPFMKGYSPTAVQQCLKSGGNEHVLQELAGLWQHQPEDCSGCTHSASFYTRSISGRPAWQRWIQSLSRTCQSVDAVLLPFAFPLHEGIEDQDSRRQAVRQGAVTLLLIDTNSGQLLWAGAREASTAVTLDRPESLPHAAATYAPWPDLTQRLLTDVLWIDFPGRLVYR